MIKDYLRGVFPVLELDSIVLRELVEEDAQDYFSYISKPEVASYISEDNRPSNLREGVDELRYWSNLHKYQRSFYWGIALKSNNQLIGTAGFNSISITHKRAELSYDLDSAFWGQGIMLKSIKNILQFADKIGIIRSQATVAMGNIRSINLLERCGFTQEGILKKYEIVEGEYKDCYMYGRV